VDPWRQEVVAASHGTPPTRPAGAAGEPERTGRRGRQGASVADTLAEPHPAYDEQSIADVHRHSHHHPHTCRDSAFEARHTTWACVPLTKAARPFLTCAVTSGSVNHANIGPCSVS
jgi:hypothetical protein